MLSKDHLDKCVVFGYLTVCPWEPESPVLLNKIYVTVYTDSSAEIKWYMWIQQKKGNLRAAEAGWVDRQDNNHYEEVTSSQNFPFQTLWLLVHGVKTAQMCYLCVMLNNTEIILFVLQPGASRPAGAQASAQQRPVIGAPSSNKTPTVKLYILINAVIWLQSNYSKCHIMSHCCWLYRERDQI